MLIDPSPTHAPMTKTEAQAYFRYLVASERLRLDFAGHAKSRLSTRALTANDVRVLLAMGQVLSTPKQIDGLGRSKYTLQGDITSNEHEAPARIVVLAAPRQPLVRVLTAMWVNTKPG